MDHPETPAATPPRLIRGNELAGILACSTSHVFAMAAAGKIPSIRIGRAVRFELGTVLEALRGDAA
jgi:excisionase family DNA binding protein